ncbi:general transcriptional corepressor tupA-like [Trichogramma pretiosum]|uniref:general transcriptional corepressor tupA-like n=1 Tax=Trichogramma pretiosum TaxID=7493 RepID=UPI0006C99DF6|nr:general transcriptional corepressor tupA-like [Trichogramma pretiosum]
MENYVSIIKVKKPLEKVSSPSLGASFNLNSYRDIDATKSEISRLKQFSEFSVDGKLSEENGDRRETLDSKKSNEFVVKHRNHIIRKIYFEDKQFGMYAAKFSSNGETFASAFGSGCIQLRNGKTGELRMTIKCSLDTSLPITSCRFHPNEKEVFFASSASGNIYLCRTDNIEFWKFAEETGNEINCIDINISGKQIVSGGKDAGIRVYDVDTGKIIMNYQKEKEVMIPENAVNLHQMRVYAVKFNPADDNVFMSGGWDNTVKIWDSRIGEKCVRMIHGPHICGDSIDIREDRLLTGSHVVKDSLQIWDLQSCKLIETINPINRSVSEKGEHIYAAQFFHGDPYGTHVIVGSSSIGNVEIINLKTKEIVAAFATPKATLAIDSYQSRIVYGGMDTAITLTEFH